MIASLRIVIEKATTARRQRQTLHRTTKTKKNREKIQKTVAKAISSAKTI
jgi:hypothetical protein